nr:10933_t:CDS:2 [Entrophospora candida]
MSPLPFVQIMLIKTTFLDLKMLSDMPSIKDLPISPLFSTVTGLCSMPPRSQDGGTTWKMPRTAKPFSPWRENCLLARSLCKLLHLILNGRIHSWKEPPPIKEANVLMQEAEIEAFRLRGEMCEGLWEPKKRSANYHNGGYNGESSASTQKMGMDTNCEEQEGMPRETT